MATYAMRNAQLVKVTGLGERARCHDPRCDWEMIARPGNGHVQPHWAHRPGSNHIIGDGDERPPDGTTESRPDTVITAEESALEIIDDGHEPLEFTCPRCNTPTNSRFYGPCPACRGALRNKYRAAL